MTCCDAHPKCWGLTSLPSLDGLTELTHLSLSFCLGLTSLPSLDGLTALQTLDLSVCPRLTSLPSLDERRRASSTWAATRA